MDKEFKRTNLSSSVSEFKKSKKSIWTSGLIIALALMFVGALASQIVPKEIFGIFERFSTYSVVIFNGVLGILGFKITEKYLFIFI